MKEEYFLEHIVDTSKYQVFLFSSPVPIPFFFARHCWFVVNNKGNLRRIEFGRFKEVAMRNKDSNPIGFINRKSQFTTGMNISFYHRNPKYGSTLHWKIETSNKYSKEFQLLQFIEKNSINYPYKNQYHLLGPNSNTYPQWVLNHFPELKVKLPFLAIGKNYLKKRSK